MREVTTDWLRERLGEERGAQARLAECLGLTASKMSLVLSGKRRLSAAEAIKAIEYFAPADLLDHNRKVPVVAYVGAGAEVNSIDDHAKGGGLDEVDAPPGATPSAVAVIVRGDSMWPKYEEGDVLIYDRQDAPENLIGKICVLQLSDGRVLVKKIRRGDGQTYTLASHNAPDIENVHIEWAARVAFVIPA